MPAPPLGQAQRVVAQLTLALVAIGYAYMRFRMNQISGVATLDQLYTLEADLPYGHRVLLPLMARPLVAGLGLELVPAFLLLEMVWAVVLAQVLHAAFRPEAGERGAVALAAGVFFVLAYPFLLRHDWPVFYPYDTPAVALTALFVLLVWRRHWLAALVLTALAAANRESTIFFPLVAAALLLRHWPLGRIALFCLALLAAHLAMRGLIAWALPAAGGAALSFVLDGVPRVAGNLRWLASPVRLLELIAAMGFLPLFWLVLKRASPPALRGLGPVAWLFFLALMLVGNVYEPRIYGELLILLYIPAALGLKRWLDGEGAAAPAGERNARLADRWERWGSAASALVWAAGVALWLALR